MPETSGTIADDAACRRPARARVCHISTVHPATDSRIFYREAMGLRDLGYEVTVAGVHPRDERIEGIHILGLANVDCRLWRMATSWCRGLEVVRRCPAEVYHFHDPELLPAAVLAKSFWGKKVVFDAHESVGLILLKDWLPRRVRRLIAGIAESVDRSCGARVDAVITPTRLLRDRYSRFARRSECFHNFPSPEFLRMRDAVWQGGAGRAKEVIHVGTLSAHRLEFFVQVAGQFLAAQADWRWTFIGLRPDQQAWVERNRPGDLAGRLTATESIPHLEVARRCCRARIGVNYHRLDSAQIQVAIPLKVFEYLACGLVTVSTRVPLLVELVEDCPAVRFADESLEGFTAALTAAARAKGWEASSDAARRFVEERFNCRTEAMRLAQVYEDILNS